MGGIFQIIIARNEEAIIGAKKHCQPLLTCLLPVPPGWERQCRGWRGAPPCNPASDCALPPEFSHCYSSTLCWYKHFHRVSSLEIIAFIVEPKKAFYDAKLLHYISISTYLLTSLSSFLWKSDKSSQCGFVEYFSPLSSIAWVNWNRFLQFI